MSDEVINLQLGEGTELLRIFLERCGFEWRTDRGAALSGDLAVSRPAAAAFEIEEMDAARAVFEPKVRAERERAAVRSKIFDLIQAGAR